MILLSPGQNAALADWFQPEQPGFLVGMHVLRTGNGVIHADRWPEPRALLVESADNYALTGDAQALAPSDLQPHIRGLVDAPKAFEPLLRATFPDLKVWKRIILTGQPAFTLAESEKCVRLLVPSDIPHLECLSRDLVWIANTWGGPYGLAGSGVAWGAFIEGRLVSVACSFFVGQTYEDIGVVTETGFRRQGLSTACVQALCRDILGRGRLPAWSTSPDNSASLRVAEKLGLKVQRHDLLYVIGIEIP